MIKYSYCFKYAVNILMKANDEGIYFMKFETLIYTDRQKKPNTYFGG